MRINDFVQGLPTATTRTNKFALDSETEAALDEFVTWLVQNDYSTGTSQSYRSYCAKAMALELDWSEMTSDMRCAVKKLREFNEQA